MKKFFSLLVGFIPLVGIAQVPRLSPAATVSLYTIKPGNDLYSGFGHSAFSIQDSLRGIDRVYNYGTFPFDEPGFYLKFARGKLRYMLSVGPKEEQLMGAFQETRSVTELLLNLSPTQKQKLFELLEENYKEENRYYQYDFFFDNCSTRLYEMLKKACGDSLLFAYPPDQQKSFRQLLDPYLVNKKIQDFGMDLGMGMPADALAKPEQYLYLPDYLEMCFKNSRFKNNSPLVTEARNRLTFEDNQEAAGFWSNPSVVFTLLLACTLLVTAWQWNHTKYLFVYDALLLTLTGLTGMLIVFLWFFTDHRVTPNNLNLFWAWPTHLIAAVCLLLPKKKLKFWTTYFKISSIAYIFFIATFLILPQEISLGLILLQVSLMIRALFIVKKLNSITHGSGAAV